MASLGRLRLPVHLCVFVPCFLLAFVMYAECSSESQSGNMADFEAKDNVMMVTTPLAAPTPPQTPFYYILALQWPPSQCLSKICKSGLKPPGYFTIHGLWPYWDNGNSPQYCYPDDKFDPKQVPSGLNAVWQNLFDSRTQDSFLGNEWAKHGTSSYLPQLGYFNTALSLMPVVNALNNLKFIGVTPDPQKTYIPSQIVANYREKIGKTVKVVCVKKRGSTAEMIGEIYFKVNRDGKTVESFLDSDTTPGCTQKSVSFPNA